MVRASTSSSFFLLHEQNFRSCQKNHQVQQQPKLTSLLHQQQDHRHHRQKIIGLKSNSFYNNNNYQKQSIHLFHTQSTLAASYRDDERDDRRASRGGGFLNRERPKRQFQQQKDKQQEPEYADYEEEMQRQRERTRTTPSRFGRDTTQQSEVRGEEGRQQVVEDKDMPQIDKMDAGVKTYMSQIYGIMATCMGVSTLGCIAPMSMGLFLHPLIPGLGSIAALMGMNYAGPQSKMRIPLLATFSFLNGMTFVPLIYMAMHMNPIIVPMAFGGATAMFLGMTAAALVAPAGSMLRLGTPLFGGLMGMLGLSVLQMFYPIPLVHSLLLYGGLGLFAVFTAYDTQVAIKDYENGNRDPVSHGVNFFINFSAMFKHLLIILMQKDD